MVSVIFVWCIDMIVLTGFTAFAGVDVNPSEKIIQYIQAQEVDDVVAEVLPVTFQTAGERIRELIRDHQPHAVMMLGVAGGRDAINLERFALNINDATVPDNSGKRVSGQEIVPDGATAYRSTLPLEMMKAKLESLEIPVVYSNHAGAYVCNHVFYCARHAIDTNGLNIPCGFIHIPMMQEANHEGASVGLPLQTMIDATVACLDVLREHV